MILTIIIGFTVMANALEYRQTSCKYNQVDKYISIKLSNGLTEKRVRFVTDGIIFDSSTIGMTFAKDYPDIAVISFKKTESELGFLSVEFIGQDSEREDVGIIDVNCLNDLKSFLKGNSESSGILFK